MKQNGSRGKGPRKQGKFQGSGGSKTGGRGETRARSGRDGRQTDKNGGRDHRDNRTASRPQSRRNDGHAPRKHENSQQHQGHGGAGLPRGARATLWGIHAVREAWLNPDRDIRALYATEDALDAFAETMAAADDADIDRPKPVVADRRALDRLTGPGAVHQGLALDTAPLEEVFVQDLINSAEAQERAVIVMLDQVTDPHNVGAIMRSACAFGATGIVMQRRHAPELDGVLVKTASGAAEHMPVAYETNLSRTIETLQEAGFTVLALDERGDISLEELPVIDKAVIILGAEGPGIRHLVKEHADRLVRLPTGGPVGALNVSNAAAVALYAIVTNK